MFLKWTSFFGLFLIICEVLSQSERGKYIKLPLTENSANLKDIIGKKKNSLICFIKSEHEASKVIKTFQEAAERLQSKDDAIYVVDCSREGRVLCRKLRLSPDPYIIHHYVKEKFNKIYNGKENPDTIIKFMKNPRKALSWEDQRSPVIHLDSKNFRIVLQRKRHALVMFYAPWCSFCQEVKPQFEEAAERFKGDPMIAFAAVDCTKEKTLCAGEDVTGYPTLNYYNYYNKSPAKKYTEERTKNKFLKYLLDKETELRTKNSRVEKSEL